MSHKGIVQGAFITSWVVDKRYQRKLRCLILNNLISREKESVRNRSEDV